MTARRVGPGLVLAALVVGIVVGERAGASSARVPGVLGVVLGVVTLRCARTGRGAAGLVCCCLAAMAGGCALMSRALDGLVHSPLADPIERRADAVVDVTLVDDPDATRFTAEVLARVDRARVGSGRTVTAHRTVLVAASGDAASRLAVLGAGDRVRLRGYLRPLDRFEARDRWRHAVGALAADDLVAFAPPASPLLRAANWLRARVLAGHAAVPEPQRSLLAGFLLGDTTGLPAAVVDDFRAAGLSHLVAVSGQNVAFVLALVGPFLRRGHRAVRLGIGMVVLVVFAAMTRAEPSVLRACAMAACSMVALASGRPTAGLRVLAVAMTILLVVDPFLVHSVGFQLSCAASAGIAVLGPPIAARVPGPRPLAEAIGVTVGAQVAVAPLLVGVFGGVPLVAVPANLVVAPIAGPLTVLGLVGGVVGGLLAGVAGAVVTLPAYLCASAVLLVAHRAAAYPTTLGVAGLVALGAGGLGLGGVFAVMRRRRATWPRARARRPESRVAVPPR